MFVFSIFVRVFLDESSGRKSYRFPKVLIKILFSELNIFPNSISMLYYARSNSMKWTLQCDAVTTSSIRYITTLWSILSSFHCYKKYKNIPRNTGVIVKSKVALFLAHGVLRIADETSSLFLYVSHIPTGLRLNPSHLLSRLRLRDLLVSKLRYISLGRQYCWIATWRKWRHRRTCSATWWTWLAARLTRMRSAVCMNWRRSSWSTLSRLTAVYGSSTANQATTPSGRLFFTARRTYSILQVAVV